MDATVVPGEGKKLRKPNNAFTVPYDWGSASFYRWWFIFMRPFIPLTNKEIEVMANFLFQRYELSKSISDPAILDTMVMSEEVKSKVIESSKITKPHFYVIMSNLRQRGVIVNNIINPRLIPNQRKDDNGVFQLLILFKEKAKHDIQ